MSRKLALTCRTVGLLALLAGIASAQAPTNTRPACALDGSSANIAFSTSGTNRVITTNFCPNHAVRSINPNTAKQNAYWGTEGSFSVPLTPTLAPSAQIINITCMGGPAGILRSGGVVYSVFPGGTCSSTGDAVKQEGSTFDECGGHSDQSGMYHYHMTPSCTLASAGATSGQHSPILGYMVDGIPIYGPLGANGQVPTDLDSCGGHSSDGGNNGQYHYHFKPVKGSYPDPSTPLSTTSIASFTGAGYPYTPGCLRGCVPDTYANFWKGMGTTIGQTSYASCVSAGTAQSAAESITSTGTPASGSSTTTTTTTSPQASGTPRPSGSGQPQPSGSGQPQPSGSQGPSPSGSGQPQPSGSQGPSPSGSGQPQPSGSQGPSPSGSGQPQPSGSQGPMPSGSGQPQPSGSQGPSPSGSGQQPSGPSAAPRGPPVNSTDVQKIAQQGNNASTSDVRNALGNFSQQIPGSAPPTNDDVKSVMNATTVLRDKCPANQQCGQDADAALNVYRAIANSTQGSGNATDRIPPADAQRIANDTLFFAGKTSNASALQQAVQVAAALLPSLKDSNPKDAAKVIDGTAAALAQAQQPGERTVVRAGNLTVAATRVDTSSGAAQQSLQGEGVTVRLPSTRIPTNNASAVVGLSAVTFADPSDVPGGASAKTVGKQRSACVEVSVSENGEKTNVSGLSSPIRLEMNVTGGPTLGMKFVCVYLDTASNNWSTNGVTTGSYDAAKGTVPCNTTHLTTFAVQETSPARHVAVMFAAVIALLVASLM